MQTVATAEPKSNDVIPTYEPHPHEAALRMLAASVRAAVFASERAIQRVASALPGHGSDLVSEALANIGVPTRLRRQLIRAAAKLSETGGVE